MTEQILGHRWINFLRGYAPTTANKNMITEKLGREQQKHNIDPIYFEHPLEGFLIGLFLEPDGRIRPLGSFRNVILTGMAGDGKTALCYTLWRKLFGGVGPTANDATKQLNLNGSSIAFRFMFDFSAFYTCQQDQEMKSNVLSFLEELSDSIFCHEMPKTIFVIAINDGQFGEIWRRLPKASRALKLAKVIKDLHANNKRDSEHRLSFLNLSTVPSRTLLSKSYEAVVSRSEWHYCLKQTELTEFGKYSPIRQNLLALQSQQYKTRMLELSSLCDACKRHIPIREWLMWLANAILGFENAPQGVARIRDLQKCLTPDDVHKGALHRNLIGENLQPSQRNRFAIFRFLDSLKLGIETIPDLDELIIFGQHFDNLADAYNSIIKPDPFDQRDPRLRKKLDEYILGETNDYVTALNALVSERMRIFFSSDSEIVSAKLPGCSIWATTVFHNAEKYLIHFLQENFPIDKLDDLISKLVCGLNRVWTGLLTDDKERLVVAKGLNFSSAAMSDILVMEIPITNQFGETCISVIRSNTDCLVPEFKIQWHHSFAPFSFELTLERFEFLMRVAEGVMPNAFSKECWEDIVTLKTKFLRHVRKAGIGSSRIFAVETDLIGKLSFVKIT